MKKTLVSFWIHLYILCIIHFHTLSYLEPSSPALQVVSFPSEPPGKPMCIHPYITVSRILLSPPSVINFATHTRCFQFFAIIL